jgi:aspartate racemase
VPGASDRQFLDDTIYGDLALGKVTPQVQNRVRDICKKHMNQDRIDAVILGCTELPLVITNQDLPIHVLDTARIHAKAILAAAS